MSEEIRIFLPAAGRGERLRPVSDHIPKPLLPVLGKPLIEIILEKVSTLPHSGIGINLHYKRGVLEDWIGRSDFRNSIELFPEETVLGTGGALKNAEEFLKEGNFIVHNADILSDIGLDGLVEFHIGSGNLATLAVHDFPQYNSLSVDEEGCVKMTGYGHCIPGRGLKHMAFTGIAVYSPEFLKFIPGGVSSVVEAWARAISMGDRISTYDVTGIQWSDMGTPLSYAAAVFRLLRSAGETVFIDPSVSGSDILDIDGYTVIEKDCIPADSAYLKNCIVLPGCRIKEKSKHVNCISGDGYSIDLNESDIFGDSEEDGGILIGTGGSDRRYYRIGSHGDTSVVMKCKKSDDDFRRYIEYTLFLRKHSIPVPELKSTDPSNKSVLIEDLGDMSLYSRLKYIRGRDRIETLYKKALDILVLLHTGVTDDVSNCPLLKEKVFDYDHFRWETGYFMERFVMGLRNMDTRDISGIDDEFHRLAVTADSFPKTVIHRDFQSQNIMIMKGDILRLIDYQGARMGPPAYDVVSILWDSYVRLDQDIRASLLNYYIRRMEKLADKKAHMRTFTDTLLLCRLQRHMQALGAFAFLAAGKGKRYFLRHIPEALRLLKEDVSYAADEYPLLSGLVMSL
ncbi:MAG TPA: hypothetical protein ENH30_04615 [Nitrospirae bacterium]|nr:hypothetical protein [Nitrospirota bacterium]